MKSSDGRFKNIGLGIVVCCVGALVSAALLHPAVFYPRMMPFWTRLVTYATAGPALGYFAVRMTVFGWRAFHNRGDTADDSNLH